MQGKTRCPYCDKNVIVEVPDDAKGIQNTKCPNCGMNIKVNVDTEEKYNWEKESPIHPYVRRIASSKPSIAGVLLIIIFLLGVMLGTSALFFSKIVSEGYGTYEAKVVDENGAPLHGVKVYLVDENLTLIAETNESGFFSIEMAAGKHFIELHKENYITLKAEILVFPSNSKVFTDGFIMKKGEGKEAVKSPLAMTADLAPIVALLIMVIFLIPLIGGVFCFFRKHILLGIIGAVFGILIFSILLAISILFLAMLNLVFFIGSILSIVALALLILSRKEFGREVKY